MQSFVIRNTAGSGALECFDRTPVDPRLPIERFKVRLTGLELSALGRVYAATGAAGGHPAPMFALMAAHWKGWQGEFVWESSEEELTLRCARDRTGHVSIGVVLRSGPSKADWKVEATVVAEAGQLEEIAQDAARFFGQTG
jgi:hypothetical protein